MGELWLAETENDNYNKFITCRFSLVAVGRLSNQNWQADLIVKGQREWHERKQCRESAFMF